MSVVPTCVQDPPSQGPPPQVGKSTKPAGSFCLCCFCQAVRCLWSLHMSWDPPLHMNLHPSKNVYLNQLVHAVSVVFDKQ